MEPLQWTTSKDIVTGTWHLLSMESINTPRQNCRHFTEHIFKFIFLTENGCISIEIFTVICSWLSNWQQVSIGSDNSLAPNRQKVSLLTAYMNMHEPSSSWGTIAISN